ncbi:nucleoside hydrolase [Paenibacillus sp. CF384]|uniref:nucleoside hydrolase n=1 Tax=Paenibacillus sp. CF384 TaxID=1884382 RepID=UPI000899CFFD|nr:nucleoside hydrolase [Paenibacillus sp. CF384]SDW90958.1 Inosine-uridine preferring nucleoside hydrolase [Paenibacillus sp. CF384]
MTIRIVLDTDIGPDCDDVGAVAVLHALENLDEVRIAGMTHCTSSKWGAGCLDALNRFYGRGDIPIGTLTLPWFLDDDHVHAKYNKGITLGYPNRYQTESAPDAVEIMRKVLAEGEDGETAIVAIGPLINLMRLLESEGDQYSPLNGLQLVSAKVSRLVAMGGYFPAGKEWNFEMHPASAAHVVANWPTPIVFSGFEIGAPIHTGGSLHKALPDTHPLRKAYEWYVGVGETRHSWDLTAVLYVARGHHPFWELETGTATVDAQTGENGWTPNPNGKHAYLKAVTSPSLVAEVLDQLMTHETEEVGLSHA